MYTAVGCNAEAVKLHASLRRYVSKSNHIIGSLARLLPPVLPPSAKNGLGRAERSCENALLAGASCEADVRNRTGDPFITSKDK